jgi:hypothetical protein
MRRRFLSILIALGVGALVTGGTAIGSYFANRAGLDSTSEILFWPNTLLQALIAAPNIGTSGHPIYEGTPLNFFVFAASFPFAMIIYAAIAYLFLRRRAT